MGSSIAGVSGCLNGLSGTNLPGQLARDLTAGKAKRAFEDAVASSGYLWSKPEPLFG